MKASQAKQKKGAGAVDEGERAKRPRTAASSSDPIMESAIPPLVKEVRQVKSPEELKQMFGVEQFDPKVPCLVLAGAFTASSELKGLIGMSGWAQAVKSAMASFDDAVRRDNSSRGALPFMSSQAAEAAACQNFMESLALPGRIDFPSGDEGMALRKPTFFMLLCGSPSCQAEKHHLATLRYSLAGTRRVILASEADLYTYMKKHNPGAELPFAMMWHAFRNFSAADVSQFVKDGHSVYACTVAPGEMLYTPAGFAVAELAQSLDGSFSIGVKSHVLFKEHSEVLSYVRSHMKNLGKSSATVAFLDQILKATAAPPATEPAAQTESKEQQTGPAEAEASKPVDGDDVDS